MRALPERFEHGGNIYIPIDGGKWLDFSANINPLGLSDSVRAAIAAEIDTRRDGGLRRL